MASSAVGCELLFEGVDFLTKNVSTGFHHSVIGLVKQL